MPGEPVCRSERRAGESVVDSGYMEVGGRGQACRGWCSVTGTTGYCVSPIRTFGRKGGRV